MEENISFLITKKDKLYRITSDIQNLCEENLNYPDTHTKKGLALIERYTIFLSRKSLIWKKSKIF